MTHAELEDRLLRRHARGHLPALPRLCRARGPSAKSVSATSPVLKASCTARQKPAMSGPLATVFGEVTVRRLAYRRRG